MALNKLAVFSSKPYDQLFFTRFAKSKSIELDFIELPLNQQSAHLAAGCSGVCVFVNDLLDEACLTQLAELNIRFVLLRCAGFNQVDLDAAKRLNIAIARVPEYSPQAVAEHCLAMILCLNRKLHKAYNRVKEDNFSLNGLLGFNLHQKTIGVVGCGKIGLAFIKLLQGFGCDVRVYDPYPNPVALEFGARFVELDELLQQSDIISLHCPLNQQTKHLINRNNIKSLKPTAMLVNTSRGGLVETDAVILALKRRQLGYFALDVYEQEADLFFEDHSSDIIDDDVFQRLLTFPNVLITGHQGFFTQEALEQIARVTLDNADKLYRQQKCANLV